MIYLSSNLKKFTRRFALSAACVTFCLFLSVPAHAQSWNGSVDNNWFTNGNWSTGTAPNSSSAVVTISNALNNPVMLGSSAAISTLTIGSLDNLNQTGGVLSVYGGSIANAGAFELGSQLQLASDLTLSGAGTLTMNNGQFGTDGYGRTLTNQSTIVGYGVIGSNSGALNQGPLSLNNSGTINANSSGNALTLQEGSSNTNSGTLEATSGGILNLSTANAINNSGGNITANGSGSTVNVNTTIQGGTINTSNGGVVQTGAGGAGLDGSSQGAITISDGSTYTAGTAGLTSAAGTLNLGTTTGSSLALSGQLRLTGDLTLSGPGSVTMSGSANGGAQIGTDGYGRTLNNQVTIAGYGVIGSNSGALNQGPLSLNNSGTINANSSGNALTLQEGNSNTNTGLLEATNGGILNLSTANAINNSGANITAIGSGSTVNVNTTIQGGTLNTSNGGVMQTGTGAFLDGSTQGAITLSNGSTYTAGTSGLTQAAGTINLGTTTGSTLALSGQLQLHNADLTFTGPGTVTMSNGQIGTDGYGRTLNNQVTIAGYGVIGSNSGALNQGPMSLNNSGTINANSSGNALTLQEGSSNTNTGLLEATSGGTLNLSTSQAISNSGANITATGGGSTVNVNTTIQGGTLNTSNGGVMQTGTSGAGLDGLTQGAITLSDGSTYSAGTNGLTSVAGTLNLGTTTGSTLALSGQLRLTGDVTLSGPGSVTMSGTANGGAQIGADGYGRTLNNQATIAGYGVIGSNSGALNQGPMALNNSGTIDANSSGNTLTIQEGSTNTNTGTLEATSGGILNLATSQAINNSSGNITSTGSGSTVNVNTTIQGGTLNTSNGGVMQTGTSGAGLDGVTQGAITLSDGSTYNAGTNGLTSVAGTLNLGTTTGSTLALSGQLRLTGDVTLSGPGSVTMSGGNAQIGGDGYGRTLTNNATIQGYGLVGSNTGSLNSNITVVNGVTGTLLANSAGNTLYISGTGGLTNNGVMQADTGSTLHATQGFTNFSGNTLTGGTYNMYSGTIQIDALGTTGGEIVNNAANILLSGPTSSFVDASGLDALSNLSNNSGSFTVLSGRIFTAPIAVTFSNSGTVLVGSGSGFTAVSGYTQTAGTTQVDGTLTSAVALNGGLVKGTGLIVGSLANNSGTVAPGDNSPGTLTVTGAYTQSPTGTLQILITGTGAGQYSVLDVLGDAGLDGVLDPVLSGFTPTVGESFTFMDYASHSGMFASIENDVFDNGTEEWSVTYNGLDAILTVDQGPNQPPPPPPLAGTPEPSTVMLSALGLLCAGFGVYRRSKRVTGR